MDKVSIIIPCYNHAKFLPDSILSAYNQTYKNFEIIVVNDGSTDNSLYVMQEFKSIFKDLIIINQENRGLSSARNAGIIESTGKYILTLDADDVISNEFLSKTVGKNDIVSTYYMQFGSKSRYLKPKSNPTFSDFVKRNQINCCSLFKKEIWKTIGGYDEQIKLGFEDWDFWLRATMIGYNVSVVEEVLFYYRKHENESMLSNAIKHYNEIWEYIKVKNKL